MFRKLGCSKTTLIIALSFLCQMLVSSIVSAQEDLDFEILSTRIASGGEMVNKPMMPRADGSKEQWPSWELRKIDDNVYSFRSGLHRSMFVITDEGVVLADPMRSWSTEILLEEIRKLTDVPVTHVIYTHNHLDHIRGAGPLRELKPQFIAHQIAAEAIGRFPHPEIVSPTQVWGGSKYEFTLGGERFELHYLGPNHGSGMTFVGLPDRKIMYIVDIISPGRLPPGLMPDFSPRGEEETLEVLANMDYERIVNGHEHAAVSSWGAIAYQLDFYRDVRVEVLKAMEKAGGDIAPWEMIRFVERLPKYEGLRYYEQWYHPVAGRILMEEYLAW